MTREGKGRKSNQDRPYAIFRRYYDRPYVFGGRNSDYPAASIRSGDATILEKRVEKI